MSISWYLLEEDNNLVMESVSHADPIDEVIRIHYENKEGFLQWFTPQGNRPSQEEIRGLFNMWAFGFEYPKKRAKFQVEIFEET